MTFEVIGIKPQHSSGIDKRWLSSLPASEWSLLWLKMAKFDEPLLRNSIEGARMQRRSFLRLSEFIATVVVPMLSSIYALYLECVTKISKRKGIFNCAVS